MFEKCSVSPPCANLTVLIYWFQNEKEKLFARQQFSRQKKWISVWCVLCLQPFFLTVMVVSHGGLILLYRMQYMTAVSIFGINYCLSVRHISVHTRMLVLLYLGSPEIIGPLSVHVHVLSFCS